MKKITAVSVNKKTLTLQYAVLQGGYWASFCATYGFATVFLLSRGFSTSQIGIVVALGNILAVLMQPTFASIADSSKKISLHTLATLLAVAAGVLFGSLFFFPNMFLATAALFLVTNTLSQTVQPLINAVSFYYINRGVDLNFGLPRSMGSLSYAIISTIIGYLVERYGSNVILIFGFFLFMIIASMLIIMPKIITEKDASEEVIPTDVSTDTVSAAETKSTTPSPVQKDSFFSFFLKYKEFTVALIGVTLIFVFHFLTNNYMLQIAERVGGNAATMGNVLSLAAAFELPAMMLFSLLLKKLNCRQLLIVSAVFYILKSISYLIAASVFQLYCTQFLQMLSYAIFLPASVYFVNECMSDQDKVKGQALMTAATTLGGVIGSLLGGLILDMTNVVVLIITGIVFCSIGAGLLSLSAGVLVPRRNKNK